MEAGAEAPSDLHVSVITERRLCVTTDITYTNVTGTYMGSDILKGFNTVGQQIKVTISR